MKLQKYKIKPSTILENYHIEQDKISDYLIKKFGYKLDQKFYEVTYDKESNKHYTFILFKSIHISLPEMDETILVKNIQRYIKNVFGCIINHFEVTKVN